MKRTIFATLAICLFASAVIFADDLANLKKYEYGGDQASLLAVERQVEDSMADKAKQHAMAATLLDVMTDKNATLAAKQHAGIMLRICGTEAEVPGLANMLGDAKRGEFAREALERIPGKAAAAALRDALGRLKGPALVGVINSTANRHDGEAVAALVGLTGCDDAKVAASAAHALGRIGGSEAAACLKRLAAGGKDAGVAGAYLACGTIAMDSGDKAAAAEIFKTLADAKYPAPVRHGALTGQLLLADDPGVLITRWLGGDDPQARRVAADNITKQSAEWLSAACRGKALAEAILFAEILAARSEKAALPILTEAAKQTGNQDLRIRGMTAMATVGDRDSVSLLIEALGEETPVSRAATSALSTLPTDLVDAAVLAAYKNSEPRQRAALSDVLVARRMTAAVPLLLELARVENDGALRSDVVFSLRGLGDETTLPKLVEIILVVKDRTHSDKMQTTYLELAKKHENTVEPIIAAMKDDASTVRLLPVLGRVGGKVALKKIDKAIAAENVDVRAAGIRALCNWPDASVADRLAKLAKDDKDKGVRTAALRAYIRVVSLKSDRPEEETLDMLKKAFQVAERPEEKVLVTERAGAVRHMQTLRWLVLLLDNEAVAQAACGSIVELAHHRYLRNPNRDEFAKALKRVIEIGKDAPTVDRAKRYLEGV